MMKEKAPTGGATIPAGGLAAASSVHSDFCSTATDNDTTTKPQTWRFIMPTTAEGELYDAILKGMLRMRQNFALTHDAARLHNDLTQLAEEIERVARAVG